MATKPKRYNPQTKFTDSTTNFSGGINQALSASRLRENEFLELINLDIDKVGQAVKRYGLKQFAINGKSLQQIILEELNKQYAGKGNFNNIIVKDSFFFFDGIRNILNFNTDTGLISIVFNEAFTDVEKMDDGTMLVLFYPNIIENVKFINYNSQFLVYVTRPKIMSETTQAAVDRDETKGYKPRIDKLITEDKNEPCTVYVWNPTNRNKVAYDASLNDETYKNIQPIGWVQNFNFKADVSPIPNFDGSSFKPTVLKSKEVQTISHDDPEYNFHTKPPFSPDDETVALKINPNQYFIEAGATFEFVQENAAGQKNLFRFSSFRHRTVEIIHNDLVNLNNNDFLNFPIIYANGYFYFGGCTIEKIYFWRISLNDLKQGKNRAETLRTIPKTRVIYNRGYKEANWGASYEPEDYNLVVDNAFYLADNHVLLTNRPHAGSAVISWWFESPNPQFHTAFELIRAYRVGDSYGKVVKYEDYRGVRYCYALPVLVTIDTTGTDSQTLGKFRAVIPTDILYDVEATQHNYAMGCAYMFWKGKGADNVKNFMEDEYNQRAGINDIAIKSKKYYNYYDNDEYLREYVEDWSNEELREVEVKLPSMVDTYYYRCPKTSNILSLRKIEKIVEIDEDDKYYWEITDWNGDPDTSTFGICNTTISVKSYFSNTTIHQGKGWDGKQVYQTYVGAQSLNNCFVLWANHRAVPNDFVLYFSSKSTLNPARVFPNIYKQITNPNGTTSIKYRKINETNYSNTYDYLGNFTDVYNNGSEIKTRLLQRTGAPFYTPEIYETNNYQRIESTSDLTFSHSSVPNVNVNNLNNFKDKLNYIGNVVFKKLNEINKNFDNKLWFGWSKDCVINNTIATTLRGLANNMRNQEAWALNNPKLEINRYWLINVISKDLKQRIKDGNISGLPVDSNGDVDTDYINRWYDEIGKKLDIRLRTNNNPFTNLKRLEALDLSNFGFIYTTASTNTHKNERMWELPELKKFKDDLDKASLIDLSYVVAGINMFSKRLSKLETKLFLDWTDHSVPSYPDTAHIFRSVFYGMYHNYHGLRVDWINELGEWLTLFNETKMNDSAKLQAINTEYRTSSPPLLTYYSPTNINVSAVYGQVKQANALVTFRPIREYIPTINDVKVNSYNLLLFDNRNIKGNTGSSVNIYNRSSYINRWDDLSIWMVLQNAEGIDTGNDNTNNSQERNFYLNGILPINSLTLNPLVKLRFKMFGYQTQKNMNFVYKWIDMSVESYNEIFFNEKYDWVKWFKDGGIITGSSDGLSQIKNTNTTVPYGDREWVVGWAIINVDANLSSLDDLRLYPETIGDKTKPKTINSASPLLATYNFIPNNTQKDGLAQRAFNDFLSTDKAITFAGRVVLYGNSNRLFFSDINNPTYFPLFNTIELPTQEKIISCVEFGYYLIVSTEDFKYILRGRSFDNNSESPFTLDNISTDTGSISVDADKPNGNYLFFLDKTGIKALVNAYGTAEKEYKFKPVDELINPLLPDLVGKQGAIATTHDNRYYIHFPNTKQMFVYYNELQTWTQYESELMNFSKLYSDNGYLYCVGRNSMDLYWFDKDTYVDGYTGLDGAWDENQYGTIWADSIGSMDGTYQKGIPIQTSLITRPIGGLDEDSIKAFYDIVINVRTNAPMNNLDLRIKLDDTPVIDTWSMSDGITNQHGMLFTHFLSTSKQQIDYYTRLFPQAVLNQTAVANYSRLGYTDLNTHKVKGLGRKGRELIIGIRNKTPASYAIESINVDYKFRSSK